SDFVDYILKVHFENRRCMCLGRLTCNLSAFIMLKPERLVLIGLGAPFGIGIVADIAPIMLPANPPTTEPIGPAIAPTSAPILPPTHAPVQTFPSCAIDSAE